MKVVLTAEAEHDLETIGDYIARGDPAAAIRFIRAIRKRCLALTDFPERFPLVPRYEAGGVRRLVMGNYLIFYRAERDRVIVLHILHGARDYGSILEK